MASVPVPTKGSYTKQVLIVLVRPAQIKQLRRLDILNCKLVSQLRYLAQIQLLILITVLRNPMNISGSKRTPINTASSYATQKTKNPLLVITLCHGIIVMLEKI